MPEASPPPARPPRAPARGPNPFVALAFAVAAVASAWNPIAAPFALVVGAAAALLGWRAWKRGAPRRRVAVAALALGGVAVVGSVAILALTAGAVGVDLPAGEAVVRGRTAEELDRTLDEAGERTRAERERAARELGRLTGERRDGGSPAPAPARAPKRDAGAAPPRKASDAGTGGAP